MRSRSGAVRPRFGAAWCPKCRPPRRKTPTKGCRGRGGLRCGHNSARPGGSLAREPAIACANRLYRTSTRYSVSGRGCPRSHQRVNVRISGPTLALAGPGADQRAHVRGVGPACVRAHILGAVSHAIRLSELSIVSTNVAIPTMRICGATQGRGIACDIRGKLAQRESSNAADEAGYRRGASRAGTTVSSSPTISHII